eukprot:753105-Pyramimonas_sp.AAC.1
MRKGQGRGLVLIILPEGKKGNEPPPPPHLPPPPDGNGQKGDLLLFFPEAKGREGTFGPTSSSSSSSSFLSEWGWKGRNLLILLCPV